MPQVNQQIKAKLDKEGALSQNSSEAGDFVSADQYIVIKPDRLLPGYGREVPNNRFHGGEIFHMLLLVSSGLRIKSHLQI